MEADNSLEVTWGRTLQVFWAVVWRSLPVGALLGGLMGGIAGGGVAAMITGEMEYSGLAGAVAGYFGGIFACIWALRRVMRKDRIGNIKVALHPAQP